MIIWLIYFILIKVNKLTKPPFTVSIDKMDSRLTLALCLFAFVFLAQGAKLPAEANSQVRTQTIIKWG